MKTKTESIVSKNNKILRVTTEEEELDVAKELLAKEQELANRMELTKQYNESCKQIEMDLKKEIKKLKELL